LTTKYSIEKTSFLWCNANVLRLNAPLVFMCLNSEGGFAATCLESRLINYAIYY